MSKLHASIATWAGLLGPLRLNGAATQTANAAPAVSARDSEGWQAILANPLAEWEKAPESLGDDGVEPASRQTIRRAAEVARALCAAGLPAAQRVAASGDGGIVFVRQDGEVLSNIEVSADGSIELTVFRDSRLVSRQRID